MKILLVGAGAIGQVYGYHLQQGGAEVSFLVKPKYQNACRSGFVLYPLQRKDSRQPVRFQAEEILSTFDEVRSRRWDQVWLCVPTQAAEDREWLSGLRDAVGNATVVSLMPGMHVGELLSEFVPESRLVMGIIGVVSYQAPLPNEAPYPEPGIAYIFPMGNPTQMFGERAGDAIRILQKGSCPAKATDDARRALAMGPAMLMPNIVGLEASGWSLRSFCSGPWIGKAGQGAREAQRIVGVRLGIKPPWWNVFLRGFLLRLVWTVVPRFMPFDVEVYLKYHFSKVRPQTVLLMRGYIEEAERHGLPADALMELERAAFATDTGTPYAPAS